ncbi:hypothetical protein TWF281_001885 [Arthrobotrys megalospora]
MRQPEIVVGNSITDYQNALNNIPLKIKLAHMNYEWKLGEKFSMSWQQIHDRQGGGSQVTNNRHRELVPGTKEPYYVEGPGSGDPMERVGGPLWGFGGLTADSEFGSEWKAKRSLEEASGD